MVSWLLSVAYGLPSIGFGAATVMISLFLPSLYVDQLGVPLGQIGAVTTAVQIFDAVTDPLVGYASDRWKSSLGRRRPFILLGSWSLAVSFLALFAPPRSFVLLWATCWALLCQLALTLARVPWLAWAIDLTNDYDQKTRVVSLRELMYVLGSLLAAALPLVVASSSLDEVSQLTFMAAVWSFFVAVNGTICVCLVRDTAELNETSVSSVFSFLAEVMKTRAAWSLWLSTVLMSMAVVSNALLYPFFVRHVLGEEDVSTLLGLYILLGALGVPFWALCSKRFDKRRTLAQATLLQAVALMLAMAVQRGSVALYTTCIAMAGVAFGGVPVLRFSMLADVADLMQLQTEGKRDEGKLVALLDISSKLAASALIALGFAVIDLSGYKAQAEEQAPAARLAIRIFYALIPALLGIASALVIFTLYPLDRVKHQAVLNQLPEKLGKPLD